MVPPVKKKKLFLDNFEICSCLKIFLMKTAFDTEKSLKLLNEKSVDEISKYVNENREEVFSDIFCAHKNQYLKQHRFQLLPGHKATILELSNIDTNNCTKDDGKPEYSTILSSLIDTAKFNNEHNANRYSDIVKDFGTFTYLTCGKFAYEFLNSNLPLPKVPTVCKYQY